MHLSYATLDVFTSTPYIGNPVAIVKVPSAISQSLSQAQKQLVAREFNYSETVFLHEQSDEERRQGVVQIDIFTPWAEIPFAGHPTVGTTKYLLRDQGLGEAEFKTLRVKAGDIPVSVDNEMVNGVKIQVAHDVHVHASPFAKESSFGHFPVVSIVKGMTFILARVDEGLEGLGKREKSFRENSYKGLEALDDGWQVGLVASYFYVDLGKDEQGVRQLRTRCWSMREDPATGSAASALCAYLSLTENESSDGRNAKLVQKYKVTQGVEMGRKSEIGVEVEMEMIDGAKAIKTVTLSGTAVKVMEGSIEIPEQQDVLVGKVSCCSA